MRARWYFSALIVFLTLFGVVSQQQMTVPNQEIVVQFTSNNVTSHEAQNTIENVKLQLLSIGADNIQVTETEEKGTLKITYYSDADVASVKKSLFKGKTLELDFSSFDEDHESKDFPSDKNTTDYNIDVYKIQNGNDTDSGLDGTFITELKIESDRIFNANEYTPCIPINTRVKDQIEEVAYKLNSDVAIAIDFWSHTIPEVRAGPLTYLLS